MPRAKSKILTRPFPPVSDGTAPIELQPLHTEEHNTQLAIPSATTNESAGPSPAAVPVRAALSAPVMSIYSLYTQKQKLGLLMLVCTCCLIVPMTDTIYLPALERVKQDLHCSQAMAALSVAVYMLGAGIMALVWGPFADRLGRRCCYWVCSSTYIAATTACIFAPSIQLLVAFRALQGGSVTGFMAGGAGIVADVFSPRQRGLASGIFSVPMLIGPVLGPLIGGAVAHSYGWRMCFVVLAIFASAALLFVLLLLRTETHQFFALQRIEQSQGAAAVHSFLEAELVTAHRPRFRPPWRPLGYLCERNIYPYTVVKFLLFGSMFASLIILPAQLAQRQSVLRDNLAGLAYVPVALACFLGAPVGGKCADVAATKLHPCKQGRMVPSLVMAAVLMPAGLLTYGWSLQQRAHLAWVLAGHACVGASVGCYMPALFSYLSVEKQQAASAVASAVQAVNLVIAGVFVQVSALAVEALGSGVFFSCLVAVYSLASACTGLYTYQVLHRSLLIR